MGNELTVAGREKPVKISGDLTIKYEMPGTTNVNREVKSSNNSTAIWDIAEENPEALWLNSDEAYKFLEDMIGKDNTLSVQDFKNFHQATLNQKLKIKDLNYPEARITVEFKNGDIMTIDFERTEERKKAEADRKEYEANTTDPITKAGKAVVGWISSLIK